MESHMTNQERTLSILLSKPWRSGTMWWLVYVHSGFSPDESSARKLLENHIQIITHIVKQLSTDIQVL